MKRFVVWAVLVLALLAILVGAVVYTLMVGGVIASTSAQYRLLMVIMLAGVTLAVYLAIDKNDLLMGRKRELENASQGTE